MTRVATARAGMSTRQHAVNDAGAGHRHDEATDNQQAEVSDVSQREISSAVSPAFKTVPEWPSPSPRVFQPACLDFQAASSCQLSACHGLTRHCAAAVLAPWPASTNGVRSQDSNLAGFVCNAVFNRLQTLPKCMIAC